jgi:two-component system, sensor histidine kinase and response regulator
MTEAREKAKILIVDDVAGNIHMLMETLKEDYAIIAAKTGLKALQLAQTPPQPALILLDVVMPEMNGHEVCMRLKQNPRTRDIPVIFVTALGEEEDEATGLRLGAIDYIQKPFSQSIVRARVKNHLERVQALHTLEAQNQSLLDAAALREDVERITRHDLKGPLNVVINAPQLLLLDDNLHLEQKKVLQEIIDAGYRMLDMINRSLDLYKMERGNYQLQAQAIDLMELLHHVCKEHDSFSALHHKIIRADKDDDATHLYVRGEELLCHSMFSNLVKNALEAAPADTIVHINVSREHDTALIRLRNQGSVPESIRNTFFDKYVSANKSGGTGLGTYSASLIAHTLKGDISVDFSEDNATTIIVRLPLADNSPPPPKELVVDANIQTLSADQREKLQYILRQGDLHGFLATLTTLQQQNPHDTLLEHLRHLAEDFKILQLQQTLNHIEQVTKVKS